MKRYVLIGLIVLTVLVALVVGAFFLLKRGRDQDQDQPKKESSYKTVLAGDLPIEERPYVSLTPSTDGHWVTLNITGIKPEVEEVEYEIVYEMSTDEGLRLEQGVIGHGEPKRSEFDSGRRLFGSESSGKYKFDKDVWQVPAQVH